MLGDVQRARRNLRAAVFLVGVKVVGVGDAVLVQELCRGLSLRSSVTGRYRSQLGSGLRLAPRVVSPWGGPAARLLRG
ncbi:MAG: hypothetical protein Q8N07_07715, partial [Rhodocyclaceae bacterium]|nr:hypothetical protein [Rhodocyclaceae bacterium]